MSDDRLECIRILNEAIAFEEEGQNFFFERETNTTSPLERDVFHSLAVDEAGHRAYLISVRDKLMDSDNLDALQMDTDDVHRTAREIFSSALEQAGSGNALPGDELDILRGALEIEKRGYRMYKKGAESVQSPMAKAVFEDLAEQEQEHYRLLSNTLDYLTDPASFSVFDEGVTLDGG